MEMNEIELKLPLHHLTEAECDCNKDINHILTDKLLPCAGFSIVRQFSYASFFCHVSDNCIGSCNSKKLHSSRLEVMSGSENKDLPSAEFARVLKVASVCATLVGADIANPKYRVNVLTIAVWLCITFYFIFTFHYGYKVAKDDWKNLLQAFCLAPSALQGAIKLASAIRYTKLMSSLVVTLKQVYAEFEEKGNEYHKVLYKSCDRQRNIVKLFVLLYSVGGFGIMIVPIVLSITKGERHLIMHFLMPGVDVNTQLGYYITQSMHATCITCGTFGLFASDLYLLIFLSQSYLFADIFAIKVAKFNELAQDRGKCLVNELYDLIKWHQYYLEYSNDVNCIFHYIVTGVVCTSSFSMLSCMFIMITGNWPGVYSFFLLSIATLYTYCFLGTQVEICDDKLYELICDIAWYQLRPPMQKMIAQMIYKAQHPNQMMVAGYMPLTVNTALRITNTLYSILMMMLQFAEAEI